VTRHDPVAVDLLLLEAEVSAAMRDESVGLDEAAFVQQQVDPLPRGELPLRVLGSHAGLTATLFGLRAATAEEVQLFAHGHGGER
jgi:hypothetical protein